MLFNCVHNFACQIFRQDRFDELIAKMHGFVAACVIHNVLVVGDPLIPTNSVRQPHGLPGNASSHHGSSHTVMDGIEEVTRASDRVPGCHGSS